LSSDVYDWRENSHVAWPEHRRRPAGGLEEAERLIGVRNRDEGEARSPTA
jgi:hypothetical protein